MRIDVFLKKVLLFKKRSEAKKMCGDRLILINGKESKPSHSVNVNDVISIETREGKNKYRVLTIPEGNVSKDDTEEYYKKLP
jgi:ribosomal 50S subunit-recycling heat shock protein